MAREMKDSCIPWIYNIPNDWKIMKMNMICSLVTDFVASGSFADLAKNVEYLDEPDYAMLIRTADVSNKGHISKPVYINKHAYDFLSNSNLFGGELLFPNIGGIGDVYIVPKLYERMSLAPNAIICKTHYYDKYYYYYFNCEAGRRSLIEISQSTAQAKFNKTDFRQIRALVPSIQEQQSIADFLDTQCTHIDSVIEKTRAAIEEYKKLKQAVITQAVTKGIRTNREMKDSGIEWIGEIPKEWLTPKMSKICTVITDYVASGSFESLAKNVKYLDEPDYAMLIRTADVSEKGYSPKPVYINQHAYDFLSNSNLYGGELILPNIGASVGDIYIVPRLYKRMSLAPNSIMIRTRYVDKYYYYYFLGKTGRLSIEDIAQSTAQAKFNKTDFRQLRVPMPNITEQSEIVAYLDEKTAAIDSLIQKKEQLITELETYKKSLIYEYVTGKKEVPVHAR